ncbi:hypothetical protein OE88DRAFT_1651775 [Heliocybe sulcata]|uniref:Uncharacterized protein n=1 Tax=Heliocybe sulcata TaxID=5364 RepID=A0A5C3NP81_9AGAM|nr:hypothetical protein OE88DRAFT_1651775 [Heliocybe sulcata]
MATSQIAAVYSCNCLNVRCRAQPTSGSPPETQEDPQWIPAFVGEEGITIVHNQVTLRKRTKISKDEERSRWIRYMSLTCLLCDTLVYRVLQVVPPEAEGSEGAVLPTEGWAEIDPLKSVNGWVEIHKECLTGQAVQQQESLPSYSPLFRIILPSEMPSSPTDALLTPATPPPPSSPVSRTYLPPMPPLFPPAPFSPSHPTFSHLASLAAEESTKIRSEAEQHLARVTQAKVDEINHLEEELRRQVELLWRKFRKEILKTDEEIDDAVSRPSNRRRDSGSRTRSTSAGKVTNGTAPVSIRSFVPDRSSSSSSKASSPPRPRAQSALSVSLASSTFHHPRADETQKQAETTTQGSQLAAAVDVSSDDSLDDDVSTGRKTPSRFRSQSVPTRIRDDSSSTIPSPFLRNMDQSKDIAASLRYFANLDEHMGRAPSADTGDEDAKTAQSPMAVAADDRDTNKGEGPSTPPETRKKSRSRSRARDVEGSPKKDGDIKSRRKVTFNVEPAVVTITREVTAEKEAQEASRAQERSGDMIFDLDDDANGANGSGPPSLPLHEPARAPRRPRGRRHKASDEGLPQSYSSLRPASLPAPSNARPATEEDVLDSPRSLRFDAPLSEERQRKTRMMKRDEDDDEPLDPREEEILKLVAAGTPSHRGAWNKESRAWQTFVQRQDKRSKVSNAASITEENGDEDEYEEDADAGIFDDFEDPSESDPDEMESSYSNDKSPSGLKSPRLGSSMPIAIGPLSGSKKVLGIPSYQPKTSLSDRPGLMVPVLRPPQTKRSDTSAALRKASYAERDRMRERDPGALDFTTEDVGEEEDSDPENVAGPGSLGRQRALKILEARSKVPSASMWRSLAE